MPGVEAAAVFPLLDWFIPRALQRDPTVHRRARMYVIAHVLGTPLGLALAAYLAFIDPHPGAAYLAIVGLMVGFYVYPFVLRATGWLTLLAPLSVQHLTFLILFGSFSYGGVSSPFLTWIGVVPLSGAFYLGGHSRLRLLTLAMIFVQVLVFYAIIESGVPMPQHVPLSALSGIGVISALCTCFFVALMALYYAGIVVAQQQEFEHEVDSHRLTEAKLRLAKEDAERADRAKSAFLANTSHELRTPLNAIIGFSEVIRNETFGPIGNERYRDYLKDIYDSGCHLLRIINDILDLSKIEAGKATLDREERVELVPAIEAALRMVQSQAEAERIAITLDFVGPLPAVSGSTRMLQQVFINLLANAVKFTPAGGKVTVRAERRDDNHVSVTISDTGIGMSDVDIEIALTAFGQVDSKMARRYEGTGLGLPLAKAIIDLHRGRLDIDSQRGRGTTMLVLLPSLRERQPTGSGAPQSESAAALGAP
ncbi:MAG TPA: HAMP domain-containing sensor histidine kinase [Stellaceae bacterium]|nr:HAMP domain-containing sensor histidine kinase [Stellaceae bacterium]